MAWIEKRPGDRYRVAFRFAGKLFRHALGDADYNEAGRCQARIEETLGLLTRGVIELPPNVDIGLFLASGARSRTGRTSRTSRRSRRP